MRKYSVKQDDIAQPHELDLRGVACPMNFVKTKLYLDKLEAGQFLTVLLDLGEPMENVISSVKAEGHIICSYELVQERHCSLVVCKA